jgi:hypothetical protein
MLPLHSCIISPPSLFLPCHVLTLHVHSIPSYHCLDCRFAPVASLFDSLILKMLVFFSLRRWIALDIIILSTAGRPPFPSYFSYLYSSTIYRLPRFMARYPHYTACDIAFFFTLKYLFFGYYTTFKRTL